MAKTFKKLAVWLLTISMLLGMVGIPAFAEEAPASKYPKVTVKLTPDETTKESATIDVNSGKLTREVNAITSGIETDVKDSYGELTAPQSALKFDRNSSTDQKAQKIARELYTDTGHFADPKTITVTGAPEGYPFKYVGFGDYSGHYVSHVRVIFERDEEGNAIKDASGNYVIKELQHSGGTPLYYNGELTTNIDGPFHFATGTRSQQFLLMNENGETFYGYCIDLETGAESASWYTLANLEDNDYYASEEAENHVRGIVFNGYWGTAEGETGSLSSLKAVLKAAIANGSVEDDYNITLVNRKSYTTGYELQEGEYHHGSYVYWTAVDKQPVKLTAEIIDQMTEGEALDAMQSAIWSWANGSRATLDGVDGMVVGDLSVASSAMSDSLNGKNDPEGAARTRALYAYLMQQTASAESVIINDKTFANDMTLTLGQEVSDDVYETELRFKADFPIGDNDELSVKLTYIDAYGNEKTIEEPLTGEGALVAVDGVYTINGLTLKAGQEFNFALNIFGNQYLEKNAYIFTSEGGTNASQTMVSMMEGWHKVDVTKSVSSSFTVKETFEPKETPTPERKPNIPTVDKTANGLDGNDQTDVTLTVPGGVKGDVDVVILLGGGMQANKETVDSAINLFKPLMESGKSKVKLGLISLEKGEEIILDLNSEEAVLNPETYKQLIEDKFAYIDGLPAGTTNLHSQLIEAKRMLDADTDVDAANKYMFVIATGRTYWFDDANGNQATVVNKVNGTYYWGHYLWQSQRGSHTSLYMIPDRYNDSYEALLADIEKWVAADGDKYVYTPNFDKNDISAYATWSANNGKDLKALGIASSRFGNGIVNPVPTAENFITGTPAAVGSGNNPQNALNYERAQYECIQVYKKLVAAGYNCYAICSESPNYQNGSEYITQGAKYAGKSTTQLGHSFMNYLATLGGQKEAPAVWDYTRDADGNIVSTATVLQENFFESIKEDLTYTCSKNSYVEDFIGKNENGNFEFIQEAKYITLKVGSTEYTTTKTAAKEGADSSYTFTAPGASEPTFWLDYYYGDGETTERFVWTFSENVSTERQASLTYKLQLTKKKTEAGTYIVPTNNEATLYPVDSNGKEGDPLLFPVPEVNYTVSAGFDIILKKVDENGNALTGAEFELFNAAGNSLGYYAVDEKGEITFSKLKAGTYKLVETTTPEGYIGISEPIYFEVTSKGEAKDAYELHFPATAYEISNHSFYPAIPQTFVLLDAENVEGWEYSADADFQVVYCADSETRGEGGVKYYRTALEDIFGSNAGKLRAIVANSYPYVSMEEMIAAAVDAGVADAANLTRGDLIAAVQLAIWNYTNGGGYTYRATYSVKGHPEWGYVYNDYEDELPDSLPKNTRSSLKDDASIARIEALYNYLISLDAAAADASECEAFVYVAEGGKDASQTLIGYERVDFYTEGNKIYVKNVSDEIPPEEPPVVPPEEPNDPPTVSFKSGEASNVSFMLIDKATGEVEFLYKVDVKDQTSFEIPTEEGKISAVFVKQGSKEGVFWTSEAVDKETEAKVIKCVDDNNPSYKGYTSIFSGEGAFEWPFKKKTITYTFANVTAVIAEEDVPAAEPVVTEPVVTEPVATEPVVTEPVVTEPVVTEPVVTEPVVTEPVATEPVVTEPVVTEPEAPKAPSVSVKGAKVASQTTAGSVAAVYIAADGKVPAVVWTSDDVDSDTLAAIAAELGAPSDAKVVSGFGKIEIEYQHNKNKTKTVTYTFTENK